MPSAPAPPDAFTKSSRVQRSGLQPASRDPALLPPSVTVTSPQLCCFSKKFSGARRWGTTLRAEQGWALHICLLPWLQLCQGKEVVAESASCAHQL